MLIVLDIVDGFWFCVVIKIMFVKMFNNFDIMLKKNFYIVELLG